MKSVMVSGHFQGFHDAHLAYLREAIYCAQGGKIICVVTSDRQLMMKKGKVTVPEAARQDILHLILTGLSVEHIVVVNKWDTETTLVANALNYLRPDIFFRGADKRLDTMPLAEWQACQEWGIKIFHANLHFERHSSEMVL